MRKVLLVCTLSILGIVESSFAQLPKYYFYLTDVFPTSQSFTSDHGGRELRFRALTVQPEEFSYIVIELIELGDGDGSQMTLRKSFVLRDADFDVIAISEVKYLEWMTATQLKLCINDKKCYIIDAHDYQEQIEVHPCREQSIRGLLDAVIPKKILDWRTNL